MNKHEQVDAYFMNDYNCSQVVLSLYCDQLGLDRDTALKLATGFGSGMGCGEACGAVSGAIMALGLMYGHSVRGDQLSKKKTYDLRDEFERRFIEKFGSIRCKRLLGYDLTSPEDMEIIENKRLFSLICPVVIKGAVDILDALFEGNNEVS